MKVRITPMPNLNQEQTRKALDSLREVKDLLSNPIIIRELAIQQKQVDYNALLQAFFELAGWTGETNFIRPHLGLGH